MNTKSFASYPILSFPITTLLLTLFFIFLLYVPRLLYLYLRTRLFHFWKRNMAKRMSHFEALDLARLERGEMNTNGNGNVNGREDGKDTKRKSKRRWDWDLERGDAEAREEEENEWVTKGEMAKVWICEGDVERKMRRVVEESSWLHCAGGDGEEGMGLGFGFGLTDRDGDGDGDEKEKEREEWVEIRMDKEIDG